MSAKRNLKIWPHTLDSHQAKPRDPFLLPTISQVEIGYNDDPAHFDDSFALEPKKESRFQVALHRCTRVLGRALVHLAPITITTGVLSLTFLQRFWTTPSSETNTVLNVLQFAAQLHGSLIIMSLSAIILDLVRHKLKRKQGISHGLLSSSFQLNSLTYLFGTEFWSGWKQKGDGDLAFLATFLFVFVLALGCQPSSAIAMIPRLQFWPVHDISPRDDIQYHAYVSANDRTLYPNFLTAANASPLCSAPNASISSSCPSAGIAGILSQDALFGSGGYGESSQGQPAINLTVDSGWRRQIIGSERPIYQNIYSSYTARTLSNFLGRALKSFDQDLLMFDIPYTNKANIQRLDEKLLARYDLSLISGGKKIPTKRPRVEVQCAGFQADAGEVTFPQNFGSSRGAALTVPSSQFRDLSANPDSQAVNFTWIDVTQFRDSNPSLLGSSRRPQSMTTPQL
jgi:hypothetical protein